MKLTDAVKKEILSLHQRHYTSREIAAKLSIGKTTVNDYLKSVANKTLQPEPPNVTKPQTDIIASTVDTLAVIKKLLPLMIEEAVKRAITEHCDNVISKEISQRLQQYNSQNYSFKDEDDFIEKFSSIIRKHLHLHIGNKWSYDSKSYEYVLYFKGQTVSKSTFI